MTDSRFVLQVERDGIRKLYGPITMAEADQLYKDIRVSNLTAVMRLHHLYDVFDFVADLKDIISSDSTPPHIHPDQTTVDEQIKSAEDYVDPATVG